MLVKTAGIVIKKIPYTDSAAVVHIFTQTNGIVPFLVQGLGKAKSKSAYYQSGQILDIVYTDKQQQGLKRIKEVQLNAKSPINLNIIAQQLLLFYTELTSLTLTEYQTDSDIYHLLQTAITNLNNSDALTYAPLRFVLELCQNIGYQINPDIHFPHLEGVKTQLNHIIQGEDPQIDRATRKHLLERLLQIVQTEAFPDKSLRSFEVINTLFS